MRQNEKLEKELQTLRDENARLKTELSLHPSKEDLRLTEEQLQNIHDLSQITSWSYDFVTHELTAPLHYRNIIVDGKAKHKDTMDMILSKIHKDDRKKVSEIWETPSKHPQFECIYRIHGDDGALHYLNSKGKIIFDDSGKAIKLVGITQEITEQQRIEQKLRLQEGQLRDAYELANIGVWSYDFETNKLIPSQQLRKIWTPPKTNAIKAFFEHIHPDDREHVMEVVKHPEKSSSFERLCRVYGDDGNLHYLLCRCVIESNEDGKAIKINGITWDITDKKLHEEQILQTESHLRFFFEKIGLGAWEYRIDEPGTYFSGSIRRFMKIKGKNGIVKNEDHLEKIHFQDLERVKETFAKVLSGESPIYDCTYRILRKENQYVWVLSRGIPIFDSKAQVYKIIGSMEDLTHSKRYNAIKERLNFMQSIADALPIPVYYKDMKGRYVGYNQAFQDFMEDSTKDKNIIGTTLHDNYFGHNPKVVEQLERDEKDFLADPSKKFEKSYTFKDLHGKPRTVINKKNILYDSNNEPQYVIGGAIEITEYEEMKSKAKIHQEQLLLADKMKSLGVLISGVAHEINNPNHFISINAALLQKMWKDVKPLLYDKIKNSPDFKLGKISGDKLEESIDDLLFGIKDGSERIGKIIDSLKAYIRNVPSDLTETFDLYDAIENVIFLLKNQMVNTTDKFTIDRKHKKLPVKGIQQKIEQVIINVLQNACQALTSREQSIHIETSIDPKGKLAIIKIMDTGSGIEPKHLNFITDPFFTTKRKTGGTGLGLSISSSILDEHKGSFKFSSEIGEGTVVEIILPLVNDAK